VAAQGANPTTAVTLLIPAGHLQAQNGVNPRRPVNFACFDSVPAASLPSIAIKYSPMLIRLATSADIPQIVELVNVAFRISEGFFVVGDRIDAAQVETMFGTGMFVLGKISGSLVSCVYLELRKERAYFGLLAVAPEFQGRGLARELIVEVERRAKEAGCGVMDIRTVSTRPELIPLYSKFGYAESGIEPFPTHVRIKMPCHFVRMSKNLL
jgi:GNAT superfamily N-acetyltransferase